MRDHSPFFFVLSVFFHILFILIFFVKTTDRINTSGTSVFDSLFYDSDYDNVIFDDSDFEEVDLAKDLFFSNTGFDHEQLSILQSELLSYYDKKYFQSSGKFIADILSGKVNDSLLAVSELLRRSALKQILSQICQNPGSVPQMSPEFFSKWLDKILKKHLGSDTSTSFGSEKLKETFLDNEELVKLWNQLFLKSLLEIGLDKLKKSLQKCMQFSNHQCYSIKLGDCDVSSHGNGGFIFGAEPDRELIREFSDQFKKLNGPFISLMASLIGSDNLHQFLLSEVEGIFKSAGLNDSVSNMLAEEFNFPELIKTAQKMQERTAGKIKDFFDVFENGLGREITDLLSKEGLFDEEGSIARNRIFEYADNYLKLLEDIDESANSVMPDLEAYAKAALDIRNRRLKENVLYEIGRGIISHHDSETFTVPEMIYIKRSPQQKITTGDSELSKPSFFSHAWGGAPRAEQPVVIDGDLKDWQDVYRYKLIGKRQGSLPLPLELQNCNFLLTQWDNSGFCFAYEIIDTYDNPCNPAAFWDTDALELFFDPLNCKDSVRIADRSYQFWVWPRIQRNWGYSGESVFLNPQQFEPRLLKTEGIQVASRRNGNKYSCEIRVDPYIMKKCILLPGKIIGFNYSIDNGDDVYIRWVTNKGINISGHPVLWGDLLLMGSNAQLKTEPDNFILPGQSIKVRIVDHDMNLYSKRQDKVVIKVRSKRTGDFLPVTCIETGINAGVFSTTVSTIFGIDAQDRQKLSVLPGDLLEIYYLDQYASGGKTNIPVKSFIQVGRGIFTLR